MLAALEDTNRRSWTAEQSAQLVRAMRGRQHQLLNGNGAHRHSFDASTVSEQRLRQAFARIDRNGDGFLSQAEVILACREDVLVRELLNLPRVIRQEDSSSDVFERFFQRLDVDESKPVDLSEFLRVFGVRAVAGDGSASDEADTPRSDGDDDVRLGRRSASDGTLYAPRHEVDIHSGGGAAASTNGWARQARHRLSYLAEGWWSSSSECRGLANAPTSLMPRIPMWEAPHSPAVARSELEERVRRARRRLDGSHANHDEPDAAARTVAAVIAAASSSQDRTSSALILDEERTMHGLLQDGRARHRVATELSPAGAMNSFRALVTLNDELLKRDLFDGRATRALTVAGSVPTTGAYPAPLTLAPSSLCASGEKVRAIRKPSEQSVTTETW